MISFDKTSVSNNLPQRSAALQTNIHKENGNSMCTRWWHEMVWKDCEQLPTSIWRVHIIDIYMSSFSVGHKSKFRAMCTRFANCSSRDFCSGKIKDIVSILIFLSETMHGCLTLARSLEQPAATVTVPKNPFLVPWIISATKQNRNGWARAREQ